MSDTAAMPYREATVRGVALGVIQGIVMTMAFTYAGLKLGFTLGGSEVAAILGFVVLRGVLQGGTIVENNINQTVASGINTASSGVIFTVPALLLMGVDFDPWLFTIAAVAGSFMGIVVIIPLRKQMIELDRLRFPSGTAVAAILKAPGAGREKATLLGAGFLLSLVTILAIKQEWLPGALDPIHFAISAVGGEPPAWLATAIALSLMNFGAGLLSGRGGMPFFIGGAVAWWLIAPTAVGAGWVVNDAGVADVLYGEMLRPLGIGVLIGGALMGVVLAFPAIKAALDSLRRAAQVAEVGDQAEELPPTVLYVGLALSAVVLTGAAWVVGPELGVARTVAVGVVGTVWIAVAGLIVAQATGMTDISPLSGMALIAVTLMLALTGNNVVVAVAIGVAVCVATSQCADMMQDLKTGHLVGSRPVAQQKVQFLVAWIGPIVAMGTMMLLWQTPDGAPGFGPESRACLEGLPGCLTAPQAGALQGMVEGVVGGDAPLDKYTAGAIMGAAVSLFPVGGMGVLFGLAMYLPFDITFGYGLGCLASMAIEKARGATFIEQKVVPFAAGLIVGEALTELGYSIYTILNGGGVS
ncbi:MAG: OPT/YSL family transporter [Alphaproteobacteria bacterium]|nr:OPT/YSL family transporter [Alphaproteobacteria bacterium]